MGTASTEPVDAKLDHALELANLGEALRAVVASIRGLRGRETHLCEGELSHAQYELLAALHDTAGQSVGELAIAARLSPPTVTQMLEHLVASGHVLRTRAESDKRVVLSSLSPLGEREIERKRANWKERWERTLADLETEELRAATRVLGRLAEMFDEA